MQVTKFLLRQFLFYTKRIIPLGYNYYFLKRIGLISDTHNFLDQNVFQHFDHCDEIWHAGDFGSIEIADRLTAFKPTRGVFGNIDGNDIRAIFPETFIWNCEQVKVVMTHIGGYPPKYNTAAKAIVIAEQPQLFICGHSHILRVMYDDKLQCLYMNPGAAGRQGWHTIRTIILFSIDETNIRDCRVVELGKRG